jgi:hypothetical protein
MGNLVGHGRARIARQRVGVILDLHPALNDPLASHGLLNHVRELMGQELLSADAGRTRASGAEHEVGSHGNGPGTHASREGSGCATCVDPDLAEVVTEEGLDSLSHRGFQRTAGPQMTAETSVRRRHRAPVWG